MGHKKKAKRRKLIRKHGSELVTAVVSALVGAAVDSARGRGGKKHRRLVEPRPA